MAEDSYRQTIDYLFDQLPMYQREGKTAFKKDLSNTRQLCKALNHPETDFRSIHIAGTNGKGSVAHLLAAPLQEMGLKVGLYTSPHYRDFRERIKIDGSYIPEDAVGSFVHRHRQIFESIKPSFFEITVAMAFWYFSRERVDIAVVETGLGGRLDSTNVLHPELSVITNIGYDHRDMLGDTLPDIAREKAGIIKRNTSVLIGEWQGEVEEVFRTKAEQENAPISFAENHCTVSVRERSATHQKLNIGDRRDRSAQVEIQALGSVQIKNVRTAYSALVLLEDQGLIDGLKLSFLASSWKALRKKTAFMGRFQFIARAPDILVDSAHNAEGIESVLTDLLELKFDKLHLVLGLVREKSVAELLGTFPKDAQYYFARPGIPRGMDVKVLAKEARKIGIEGSVYKSVPLALDAAKEQADQDDLVFVGGSTFTVAEVL